MVEVLEHIPTFRRQKRGGEGWGQQKGRASFCAPAASCIVEMSSQIGAAGYRPERTLVEYPTSVLEQILGC